jgi:hypothetical protein
MQIKTRHWRAGLETEERAACFGAGENDPGAGGAVEADRPK